MNQQIFVPVTDELIYNHPEAIEGPLVPYFAGMECQHWLSIEINPDESDSASLPINNENINTNNIDSSTSTTNISTNKKNTNLRLVYSS